MRRCKWVNGMWWVMRDSRSDLFTNIQYWGVVCKNKQMTSWYHIETQNVWTFVQVFIVLVHYNTIFYTEKNSIKFIRMIFISFNSDIFNSIPSILLQDQMYFTFEDALHVYCVKYALRIRVAPDVNVWSHYRPAFATCKQFIRIFRLSHIVRIYR